MAWQVWAVTYLLLLEVPKQRLRTTLKAREKIQEPVAGSITAIPFSQKFLQLNFSWTLGPYAFLASWILLTWFCWLGKDSTLHPTYMNATRLIYRLNPILPVRCNLNQSFPTSAPVGAAEHNEKSRPLRSRWIWISLSKLWQLPFLWLWPITHYFWKECVLYL